MTSLTLPLNSDRYMMDSSEYVLLLWWKDLYGGRGDSLEQHAPCVHFSEFLRMPQNPISGTN